MLHYILTKLKSGYFSHIFTIFMNTFICYNRHLNPPSLHKTIPILSKQLTASTSYTFSGIPFNFSYQTWQQRSTLISFTLSLLMWFMPNAKTEQTKTSPVSIPFNLSASYLLCFCSYLFFLWSSVSVTLFLLSSFAPRRLDYILHRIDANSFACLVIWNCLGELRIKK